MKPRPILSINATTIEIVNTMQTECKWVDQELTSARHEIKDAKEFLKSNFTSLIPSVNWSDMWDDNNATVEILKTVCGKLKNQNSKFFNESTKSMQEIESNLTRIQDDLNFCKTENENVFKLASIQYEELDTFIKNKGYAIPILGASARTLEILQYLKNETRKIIFLAKQSLEECKINSTQLQENFKICNDVNKNINSLVLIQYQETMSSLETTTLTTSEMLNAIKGEYKIMEEQFFLAKEEIKNAKGFVKKNLTSIIPSVDWNSYDIWNDNHTTVELLKNVYGEWIIHLNDHDKLKFELSVKENFIKELLRKDFSYFDDKINEFNNIL
jgi:hypothetical protein